jgi:hypothetical protein
MDYRFEGAKHLPFKAMLSPADIPYPNDSFDTVIIKTVLHHIDESELPRVLEELCRIGSRLIIEEDTFDLSVDTPGLLELSQQQTQLKRFIALSPEDQLCALMLIDYFGNAIAQGLVDMNCPFQFKTMDQWAGVLKKHRLQLNHMQLLGFQPGNVNKTCQVRLIVDRLKR